MRRVVLPVLLGLLLVATGLALSSLAVSTPALPRQVPAQQTLLAAQAAAGLPASAADAERDGRPLLLLVSLDGWRWDYHERLPVPTLRALIARGTRAEALVPSFPSKTFPNHYTIVTGLYPGHHGIVANNIFDPGTGRMFSPGDRAEVESPLWWGGEPLWVGVERAGGRTATMFWPGSEAPIRGVRPSHYQLYDASVSGTARVDQVLAWLDLPAATRPSFVTLYFEDVDDAGHGFGPDSPEVREAASRIDGYLRRLLDGLAARGLLDTTNLVVVSDHGMAPVSPERTIVLDDYVAPDDARVIDINPTLALLPRAGRERAVYDALRGAHPRLRVYRRDETPRHWHFRDHPRIAPLIGVVDEGWQIVTRAGLRAVAEGRARPSRGQHGYDPREAPTMRGLFVAAGPAFREGAVVPAFGNVHVYPLLARLLGIPPAPNDGNPEVTRRVLRRR